MTISKTKMLAPTEIEATFRLEDEHGRAWLFHLAKVGGGTVGKMYGGDWNFTADLVESTTKTIAGTFTLGTPGNHLEAALDGWALAAEQINNVI